MKKTTFQIGLLVILTIIILLQVIDICTGKSFFDGLVCLFLFIMGINVGLFLELE